MKNQKSVAVRESLALIEDIYWSRQEYGSDRSTKARTNKAEYALNELLTLLVLRMEESEK